MSNFKKSIAVLLVVVLIIALAGCNKQLVDTTYSYDRAIIYLPNGEVIDTEISSWRDYEDGDQIQVSIDGKTYLVHSSNIVLVAE